MMPPMLVDHRDPAIKCSATIYKGTGTFYDIVRIANRIKFYLHPDM